MVKAPTERMQVGETITLDGSGSGGPDEQLVSYEWTIDPPVGTQARGQYRAA
jgi:hypothetical protein